MSSGPLETNHIDAIEKILGDIARLAHDSRLPVHDLETFRGHIHDVSNAVSDYKKARNSYEAKNISAVMNSIDRSEKPGKNASDKEYRQKETKMVEAFASLLTYLETGPNNPIPLMKRSAMAALLNNLGVEATRMEVLLPEDFLPRTRAAAAARPDRVLD
jgi:hypothetical protein